MKPLKKKYSMTLTAAIKEEKPKALCSLRRIKIKTFKGLMCDIISYIVRNFFF